MSEWLQKFLDGIKKDKKRSLLILVLVGVLILVIAWPVSEGTDSENGSKETNVGSVMEGDLGETGTDSLVSLSNGGYPDSSQSLEEYITLLEERLTGILSNISGAGKVQVMITARATREKVVEKDVNQSTSQISESDSNGGTRITEESSYQETSLYTGTSSGQDSGTPYVVKELVPEIEGVVVAAQGAGDEYVIDEITQSVSVLFDLPVHKIKVVKMES